MASPLTGARPSAGARPPAPADLSITGTPRPVAVEASLAAYRTAQEALTNARKHAPGQPVRLTLEYWPAEIVLRVVNPLPIRRPAGRWPPPGPVTG